ncbi:cytochrome P450 [Streptomyces candidus]|uniref:Fatty-acid peroxygenase n=1 Tax=Streptomyces candidus TaxID=67283 RepID=A0A7X0LN53_9ACTN|nr:cytochrome P450 [Streptomyces candidus]MBB6434580.1 fatty-acid peroxygenase [Streptomyces candidus]GHH36194.1 fatty-acid peroxygenase [Streptomyces candidus]
MIDDTLPLLMKGYAWLPDARRRNGEGPLWTRLAGRRAVALHGTDAVHWFYDERNVRRQDALPGPLLDTLFGRGAVHTLDGEAHRTRKAMFLTALREPRAVGELADLAAVEWDRAAERWADREEIVLFDETAEVLTRAVCAWAGVALPEGRDGARRTAEDLVAMVDGFATAGPRHFRARRARKRQEARIADLVTAERTRAAEAGSHTGADVSGADSGVLAAVARHRDSDGSLLDPHTAAVEVLNVVRPTVAVTWFLAFAAHAQHRWPAQRTRLVAGGAEEALAFAQEVRRFYPFAPFVAGLATDEAHWQGEKVPAGTMVLLDLYGLNHDEKLWPDPYVFDPDRFLGRSPDRDTLVPQGGGDPATGHRCPGEDVTVALLATLAPRLARLSYDVPDQDLGIALSRIPARPRSKVVLRNTQGAQAGRPLGAVRTR